VSGRALRWLASLAPRPRAGGAPRLVILRHHRVYAAGERPLYRLGVGEEVLRAQLETLARRGLAPVTVSEGLAALAAGRPGPVVALTFDDGYADNVRRALPLLRATGARATFFLAAGLIEERRAPWWDELAHGLTRARVASLRHEGVDLELATPAGRGAALRALLPRCRVAPEARRALLEGLAARLDADGAAPCELATWDECAALAAAGMELGAHTLTHPHLSTLTPVEQEREIEGSFALVERRLGARPRGFAYPGGDLDEASLAAASRAGDWAVTTRAGDNRAGDPPHTLRRRGLGEGACLGPGGRFSERLLLAEVDGLFDGLRATRAGEWGAA
jgi:peptidoglycan/xylan/chitin deacetylase (PgdA/CDA1 family)